ncbi:MAG: FAD binding domain-containing protein [Synergistaceae bacterium]|nr:FAD binding domain-containing protein [Synergistaceae bacterium]
MTASENAGRVRIENYIFAADIKECVDILLNYKGKARVIAGGTDLVLWAKTGKVSQKIVVDISRIDSISQIEATADEVILGACVTHAVAASNEIVRKYFTSLAKGCQSVGSPQIRNIGTLGGNIISAQPAADSVIPMVAIGAKCEIVSADGIRVEPLEKLHVGVGKISIDPTKEIITRIFLPIPSNCYATAFTRIAPRAAMALPIANCSVMLIFDGSTIKSARIVLAPVATTPFRSIRAENILVGGEVSDVELRVAAGREASEEARPRDSLQRGSGAYRKVLVEDLVSCALMNAASDIKEGQRLQ